VRLKIAQYASTLRVYARESLGPRDFARLVRVRLSQSKLGKLVCPRPIVVDVNLRSFGRGLWLRSHTTDIAVLGEVVEGRSYAPLADAATDDVQTIADLGANTGIAARWLLERFPTARLVAVEPHPANVSVLERNLQPYGARARIVPACIGARARQVGLSGTREDGYKLVEVEGGVSVVTMDTVFAELGAPTIDVLKVDIEGTEDELFTNESDWVERVGLMSVECHHPFSGRDLLDRLGTRGANPRLVTSSSAFDYEMVVVDLR
jgi:FkbM family methyltransferase